MDTNLKLSLAHEVERLFNIAESGENTATALLLALEGLAAKHPTADIAALHFLALNVRNFVSQLDSGLLTLKLSISPPDAPGLLSDQSEPAASEVFH